LLRGIDDSLERHYQSYHNGKVPLFLREGNWPQSCCYTNLKEFLADSSVVLEKKENIEVGKAGRRKGWRKQ